MREIHVDTPQAAQFRRPESMIEGEHEHSRIAPAIARGSGPQQQAAKLLLGQIVASPLMRVHRRGRAATLHTTLYGAPSLFPRTVASNLHVVSGSIADSAHNAPLV